MMKDWIKCILSRKKFFENIQMMNLTTVIHSEKNNEL